MTAPDTEATLALMREALLGLAEHELDDGPCFCHNNMPALETRGHYPYCEKARAALSSPPQDSVLLPRELDPPRREQVEKLYGGKEFDPVMSMSDAVRARRLVPSLARHLAEAVRALEPYIRNHDKLARVIYGPQRQCGCHACREARAVLDALREDLLADTGEGR